MVPQVFVHVFSDDKLIALDSWPEMDLTSKLTVFN